jgi:hypothetical protein
LFYGYATGVFSSRKLEKATYDSIAFRYICANTNPDHDTIVSFRKRFLKELGALFVEILVVALPTFRVAEPSQLPLRVPPCRGVGRVKSVALMALADLTGLPSLLFTLPTGV